MSLNRWAGYALCVSALINLLQSLWHAMGGGDLAPVRVAALAGAILLIAGLPAIQGMQPRTGRGGLAGLALMEAGALVALALNLYVLTGGSSIDEAVPFAGALLGLAGALLVGALTIRAGVFPAWAGWLLIVGGALNFTGGLPAPGALIAVLGFIGVLAISTALLGFGLHIIQASAHPIASGRHAWTDKGIRG
jgi:hypothetical protein